MPTVSKFVPLAAVPGLLALWAICTATIAFLAQLPYNNVAVAVSAVPLALLFYLASEFLEAIFDRWYGWSESVGTRLKQPKTAVLPSGRDLDEARLAAIRELPASDNARYPGEGVYQRAKELIEQRSKTTWREVAAFSVLNKLCRGLAMMSLFVAISSGYLLLFYEQLRNGAFGVRMAGLSVLVLATTIVVAMIFGAACFIGFVRWKWEHMIRVYRSAVQLKRSAPLPASPPPRQ